MYDYGFYDLRPVKKLICEFRITNRYNHTTFRKSKTTSILKQKF